MREHWVEIEEFPMYFVSSLGRIMNRTTGRILRPAAVSNSGYFQAHFRVEKNRFVRYIHRVVVENFFDVDLSGYQVDHVDGDKWNNAVWNLEVVTASENSQLAYDRGVRVPPSMTLVVIIETGQVFRSVSDCARHLNRSLSTVWAALKSGRTTAGYHIDYFV